VKARLCWWSIGTGQHSQIGYNDSTSNLLAAARGQLQVLDERVAARRRNFSFYHQALGGCRGIAFMPAGRVSVDALVDLSDG
jgi:dTDP-4-amino-4,6-dideoxygalactose transaminase